MPNQMNRPPEAPESGLMIRLLGPFEIWRAGIPIPPAAWGRRKTQALLKLLLTQRGRAFHQEELIEALYPHADPESMQRNLLGRISELRRALEPDLSRGDQSAFIHLVGKGSYRFHAQAPCWTDVEAFQERVDAGRAYEEQGRWVEAGLEYEQAVSLYRGDYLADEPYASWVLSSREQWRDRYLDTLEALSRCEEKLGRYREAAAYAVTAIQTDPYREEAYRQQMRSQYLDGRELQASQTYEACRQALADLGVAPAQETQALYAEIRERRLRPAERAVPHNVPQRLTPCIGREEEEREVTRLLAGPDCRLVTLVGPGGIGKSRLATQVAAALLSHFPDGVWFVDLTAVDSPDRLVGTILQTLPLSPSDRRDPKGQLVDFLREKAMLLVLDNFEQILPAVDLVSELLVATPRVRLLVTSRERLRVDGEWTVALDGLQLPEGPIPGHSSAVDLFLYTARRRNSRFALGANDLAHVVRICRLVDGFPLGIELAASWVGILTCAEIAAEIGRTYDAQAAPEWEVPDRHGALRATVERSYHWLSDDERAAWVRLSVFRGGFGREVARQVVGASPSVLAHLVDTSMLRNHTPGRFDLHEVLRQFALEIRLTDPSADEELQRQHCRYFAERSSALADALVQGDSPALLSELSDDLENLRAAWRWAVATAQVDELDRTLDGLSELLVQSNRNEMGMQLIGMALERVQALLKEPARDEAGLTALLGRLAARYGHFCEKMGDLPRAREWLQEGLRLGGLLMMKRLVALSQRGLAQVAWRMGEYQEATTYAVSAQALSRELSDRRGAVHGLRLLGNIQRDLGELSESRRLHAESLAISRSAGFGDETARALANLAVLAGVEADNARAIDLFQQALELFQQIGNQRGAVQVLENLGTIAYNEGRLEEAHRHYSEQLVYARRGGDPSAVANAQIQMGGVLSVLGETEQALAHLTGALSTCLALEAIPLAVEAVFGLALFSRETGALDRAVQLLALILHHPGSSHHTSQRAEQMLAELAEELPAEALAVAEARGAGLDLGQVAAELLS